MRKLIFSILILAIILIMGLFLLNQNSTTETIAKNQQLKAEIQIDYGKPMEYWCDVKRSKTSYQLLYDIGNQNSELQNILSDIKDPLFKANFPNKTFVADIIPDYRSHYSESEFRDFLDKEVLIEGDLIRRPTINCCEGCQCPISMSHCIIFKIEKINLISNN